MKFSLSPTLVKNSLSGHTWIGLLVGALMYLVCLSGTLAVFYPEFQRWEQPGIAEYLNYDPALMESAYREALQKDTADTHHMFMLLPTDEMPRASISSDTQGWFIAADGSLSDSVSHPWTDMLVNLHLYLHLPTGFGMIVVSILGALLCGLIVSGFLAHPRIFKDAFTLRLNGSRHLEQADIHNRLSVWGAPFHLMIAVTGAFFGLAMLMNSLFATASFEGDVDAVIGTLYGDEPALHQTVKPPAIESMLRQMETIAPTAVPFYITVEDVNTPEQYTIVGARHPGRLIYAEQYRFDTSGNYLGKAGFSDGDAGRQALFSVYRIHFGHFGGYGVKILFGVLGLALTVISVTGINIWFARRKTRDAFNNLWTGFVWGAPVALTATAIALVLFKIPSLGLFWVTLVVSAAFAQWTNNDMISKKGLLNCAAFLLVILVIGYAAKFKGDALTPVAFGANSLFLLIAALFHTLARRLHGPQTPLALDSSLSPGDSSAR
jgi:uncharacterized iron-regulated membrane protein